MVKEKTIHEAREKKTSSQMTNRIQRSDRNPYDLTNAPRGMNPIDPCDNLYDLTHVAEQRRRQYNGR
ncbi:MAG: hypothetical protein AABW79_03195 [Nanoarchaeota archaeon]